MNQVDFNQLVIAIDSLAPVNDSCSWSDCGIPT